MSSQGGPLDVIQRLRQPPALPRPGEKCEMCAVDIPDQHSHVVNLESRGLMCACRPCYLLFTAKGAGKYRAVPDRYVAISEFALSPGQWESLQIPVSVAFFFRNSEAGQVVAFYPSPAGATESLLDLGEWDALAGAHPGIAGMEPDVEALLVRAPSEAYVVPIDACYELIGHMRRLWRGFDGGAEARTEMNAFFDRVRYRARVPMSRHPESPGVGAPGSPTR